MLIRIIKELRDLPEDRRPVRGKVYDSVDMISGKYNAQENQRRIIMVNGHTVAGTWKDSTYYVLNDEEYQYMKLTGKEIRFRL